MLRTLRWKLFVSHLLIILIAVVVLLLTARVLASTELQQPKQTLFGSAVGLAGTQTVTAPTVATFQAVVEQALLIASFATQIVAVVISLLVSHRIVQPLQTLSQVSRRLAQGSYYERTELSSKDELAELSHSIDQLAEALEHTERRRMTLIADVAHELRTPLTTIDGYMEGLMDGMIPPGPQAYSLVLRESVRLQRLVNELVLLSRIEANEVRIKPEATSLWEVAEVIREQLTPLCDAQQIQFVVDPRRALLGISDDAAGIFGLPVAVVVMWLVSSLTAAPSAQVRNLVDMIRSPEGESLRR